MPFENNHMKYNIRSSYLSGTISKISGFSVVKFDKYDNFIGRTFCAMPGRSGHKYRNQAEGWKMTQYAKLNTSLLSWNSWQLKMETEDWNKRNDEDTCMRRCSFKLRLFCCCGVLYPVALIFCVFISPDTLAKTVTRYTEYKKRQESIVITQCSLVSANETGNNFISF